MGRWGRCDYRELKKLDERLQQLSEVDMDRLCRDAAKKIAQILLNKVKKRTPVGVAPKFDGPKTVKVKGASGKSRTFLTRSGAIREQYWAGYRGGSLRDAWTILPIEKHGDQYTVTVINNLEYASYVEYGHRQTPGRYVPALGNEIIKGVSMKLNATFGAGYKIYQNDVEQGFKEPCFFIAVLKPDISPLQKNRFMNRNPLDVHYFPTSGRNNAELFTMAGDLMECLEFITLPNGDVLHGTSMSYEVQDGVLHFFVNYNLTLRIETEETAMETLETTVEPKKG